jgi:DNA-binding NarL/FixJ family response regulator
MESLLEALASSRPLRIVNTKGVPLLTKREDEIAHLVATGFANQEISSRFRLKLHTVKNHLFHIYEKLGISSRGELILYALSHQGTSKGSHSNSEKAA